MGNTPCGQPKQNNPNIRAAFPKDPSGVRLTFKTLSKCDCGIEASAEGWQSEDAKLEKRNEGSRKGVALFTT